MLKDNTNQNDIQAQGRLKKRDHGKLYQGDGGSATDDFALITQAKNDKFFKAYLRRTW